jgi:hypothetical protein
MGTVSASSEVVEHILGYPICSSLMKRFKQAAPADENIDIVDSVTMFSQKVDDDLFAKRQLVDDRRKMFEILDIMLEHLFLDQFIVDEDRDFRRRRPGIND